MCKNTTPTRDGTNFFFHYIKHVEKERQKEKKELDAGQSARQGDLQNNRFVTSNASMSIDCDYITVHAT